MRWLVILILVLHPVAGLSSGSIALTDDTGMIAACAGTSGCCCMPVSCCSREPVPPCGCMEDQRDAPPAPPSVPSESRSLIPIFVAAAMPALPLDAGAHPVIRGFAADAVRVRTHNQQQALLCVWRT
jgi:hypothetical protein